VLIQLLRRGGPYATVRGHLRVIREEKKAGVDLGDGATAIEAGA